MKYASTKTYGGRRAHITADVVIRTEDGGIAAGTIDGIDEDETVWITEGGEMGCEGGLIFHPTQTAEDIEAMPVGRWTWPVRV